MPNFSDATPSWLPLTRRYDHPAVGPSGDAAPRSVRSASGGGAGKDAVGPEIYRKTAVDEEARWAVNRSHFMRHECRKHQYGVILRLEVLVPLGLRQA